jgi:hypothetical protein
MRCPHLRFTVRRLMIAVGVAGAMLGGAAVIFRRLMMTDDEFIREWTTEHPGQPKPELIASGTPVPLPLLLPISVVLGGVIIATVLLGRSHDRRLPDTSEPIEAKTKRKRPTPESG